MITNFKLNAESVFEQVSAVCGVSVMRMQTKGRHRDSVRAKRMFCAILRENTKMTFLEIGKLLNQDHSTVIHHINKHKSSLVKNKKGNFVDVEYAEKYKEVDDILNERVSVTNHHYIFTYKIEKEDNNIHE